MSRILNSADWVPDPTTSIPASAVKKCYKVDTLRSLVAPAGVLGVLLTFSGRRLYRRPVRSIPSPLDNQILLMKDLIDINFSGFNSLDLFIANLPRARGGNLFILERSMDECGGDEGPGGDGLKVTLP